MVLVHDTLSKCSLQMYEVSLNTSNGYQVKERTRNNIADDLREMTPNISTAELWFLCMTCCLNVFYKCMKFH